MKELRQGIVYQAGQFGTFSGGCPEYHTGGIGEHEFGEHKSADWKFKRAGHQCIAKPDQFDRLLVVYQRAVLSHDGDKGSGKALVTAGSLQHILLHKVESQCQLSFFLCLLAGCEGQKYSQYGQGQKDAFLHDYVFCLVYRRILAAAGCVTL